MLLSARSARLLQARDAYYTCVEAAGEAANQPGAPVPPTCREARRAYEGACSSAWVRHFDALRDKRLKYLQTLQSNIAASAAVATGTLAGKEQ